VNIPARLAQAQDWPAVAAECGLSEKEPAIGDGCQSREVMLRNVIRFAAALCVVVHTRTGKLFGRGLRSAPVSVEPLSAAVDLLIEARGPHPPLLH
jgi:hypothetical protein